MKRERWLWVIGAAAAVGVFILYLRYQKPAYEMNPKIAYQCIQYNFAHPEYASSTWSSQEGTVLHDGEKAFKIVTSVTELETIISRIEHFSQVTSTANLIFDDSFFQSNALLLVEVCENPSATTVARPEDIADENGTVTLTVKWGTDGASVANNGGSLLLIPVSAECTEADVAFAFEYWLGDDR